MTVSNSKTRPSGPGQIIDAVLKGRPWHKAINLASGAPGCVPLRKCRRIEESGRGDPGGLKAEGFSAWLQRTYGLETDRADALEEGFSFETHRSYRAQGPLIIGTAHLSPDEIRSLTPSALAELVDSAPLHRPRRMHNS